MSTVDPGAVLHGSWSGRNRLWLDPSQPAQETVTRAVVAPVAGGHSLLIRYTWAADGRPQDGVILAANAAGGPAMAWTDSWHMGKIMMVLEREDSASGISARGSYAAPTGPDWGWRITVGATGEGGLRIAMFNLSPDGEVYPAVEANYQRDPVPHAETAP